MKLDHPALAGRAIGRELLVVHDPSAGHVEDSPARVVKALAEVGLVGVDEELGVQVADRGGRLPRRTSSAADCTQPTARVSLPRALRDEEAVQEEGAGDRRPEAGQPPGAGLGRAGRIEQPRSGGRGSAVGAKRLDERLRRPREQLGVLVEQQAELAASLAQQSAVERRLALTALAADQPQAARRGRSGAAFQASTASADPSSDALSRTRTSASIPPAPYSRIESRQASSSSRPLVLTTQ